MEANVGAMVTFALAVFNLTSAQVPDPSNPLNQRPLGNLTGFDVQMSWNASVLNLTGCTVTSPWNDFKNPVPPSPYAGVLYAQIFELANETDQGDSIPGAQPGTMLWRAYSSMNFTTPFNGNGTLLITTFKVIGAGSSLLNLITFEMCNQAGKRLLWHQYDGYFRTRATGCYFADVFRTPESPSYDEMVTVSADIRPANECDTALLSFNIGSTWVNVSMVNAGNYYNATIPGLSYGTLVQYELFAKSLDGNWTISLIYSYVVGDDVPPDLTWIGWFPTCPYPYWPSSTPRPCEPVDVEAAVTEPGHASGVDRVFLFFVIDGVTQEKDMIFNATSNLWVATIPGQCANTTVDLFILARDKAGNTVASANYQYTVKSLLIGDINGDGKVDLYDAVLLLSHYGEKEP
jgi:hypothetical protein